MSKATFSVLLVLMVLCSTACAARVRYAYEERARMAQRPVTSQNSDGGSITLML